MLKSANYYFNSMHEYAAGLIRVLEKDILDKNDIARMLEAQTQEGAFNVLNDTDLKDNILGIKNEEFEEAIKKDEEQTEQLIKWLCDFDKDRGLYDLIYSDKNLDSAEIGRIKNPFLRHFFRLTIDFLNIKIILRAKKIGIENEKIKEQLTQGGNLKIQDLISGLKIREEKNFEYLREQEEIFASKDILEIEKKLDVFLLKFLRDGTQKLDSGPEILFYYVYLKKMMNINIKLILTGKINNLPLEEIKKRLRI